MSLQRVQAETTSTEFLAWAKFLANEDKQHTREHYYLAQISADIRRQYSGKKPVKIADCLLKFNSPETAVEMENLEDRQTCSKNAWSAILGSQKKR